MNLEEAIASLIELGEKDPVEIARKLDAREDEEWKLEQALAYWPQFVAELARHRLGAQRRSAQVALRPGDEMASAELKNKSVWVPGTGWMRAADMTVSDIDLVAQAYVRLSGAMLRRADWYRQVAALMRAEGAKTLGRLKAGLPSLPAADLELEAVA